MYIYYNMSKSFNTNITYKASSQNKYYTNVNDGYRQNLPLIDKIDYTNQNNVLHNNLADNLLSENINEYNIYIDSNDRNKDVFYSPFEFKVNFGTNVEIPKIDQEFNNVKYVNLNYLILPPTNIIYSGTSGFTNQGRTLLNNYLVSITDNGTIPIVTTASGVAWPVLQTNSFTKNRYIIVKIKELDNCRTKSTSCYSTTGIDKNSFVLFYEDDVKNGDNIIGTIWKPKFGGGSKVFLSSELKTSAQVSQTFSPLVVN